MLLIEKWGNNTCAKIWHYVQLSLPKFNSSVIHKMDLSVTLTPKTRLQKALHQAGVNDPTKVVNLAITGRLTDDDIKYIRENMGKTLQELDLSRVSFQKNVIPCGAFNDCTGLTSVIFSDTIAEIGYRAFSGCTGLTSVFIPALVVEMNVTDILFDFWAFAECHSLTSIEVHPDNPKFASEDGVLYNKEKTSLIKCPNGRKGDYLIPETVTYLGRYPFSYNPLLTSFTAPPNNPEFSSEDGVLFNKEKTELIKYPNGRQGDYVIPESVVKIYNPFDGCTALNSICIPASVVEIGWVSELNLQFNPWDSWEAMEKEECVFFACAGLTSITVDANNPFYSSEDGVLFNKDKTELIVYPKGRQGDYVVPASVIKLRTKAFRWSTGLTSITIPESVTEIGSKAFEGCNALTSIIIPKSVTILKSGMFQGCIALTSIVIPDSVVKISNNAFDTCTGLTSIFIPASVIEISMRHWDDEIKFYKCPAFVTVHSDNHKYTSRNGKILYKNVFLHEWAEIEPKISGLSLVSHK